MAEVIQMLSPDVMLDEHDYHAQVCGRPVGNIWEGWIEFVSADGKEVRRTPRETTQPTREALAYWAEGLSPTYLEGALKRTLPPPPPRRVFVAAKPFFDGPAEAPEVDAAAEGPGPERAVLDPFSVGAKSIDLLRQELSALRGWHLRNIIRAYALADGSVNLAGLTEPDLVELITRVVARELASRHPVERRGR
jgi:hypothetical protein